METKGLDECRKEMENMKKTIANMQNDRRVGQLESQLFEERDKCQALKKQIQVKKFKCPFVAAFFLFFLGI